VLRDYDNNNMYIINYEKTIEGYFPQFCNYVDQEVLVIRHKSFEDDLVKRFISYIKWSHYVQTSKWNVKWLFVRYVILEEISTQPPVNEEIHQNGGFTTNNDNVNDNNNNLLIQFGS